MPSEETVRSRLQHKNYEAFVTPELVAILWSRGLNKSGPPSGISEPLIRWPKDDLIKLLRKLDEIDYTWKLWEVDNPIWFLVDSVIDESTNARMKNARTGKIDEVMTDED